MGLNPTLLWGKTLPCIFLSRFVHVSIVNSCIFEEVVAYPQVCNELTGQM